MYNQKALQQYQSVDVRTAVENASPHQLISLLFDGTLGAISKAKGMIERKDIEGKNTQIQKASKIVIALKGSLDQEKGGEVAGNLDALYDYLLRRLLEANRDNDIEALNEVGRLVGEIKAGWNEIPEELRK